LLRCEHFGLSGRIWRDFSYRDTAESLDGHGFRETDFAKS
jgi:hypothetical protein